MSAARVPRAPVARRAAFSVPAAFATPRAADSRRLGARRSGEQTRIGASGRSAVRRSV